MGGRCGLGRTVTESAGSAIAIAVAALGAAYLLRVVGDTGPTWVSWISPTGWAMRVRAYAGEQWWVFALLLGLAVAFGAAAYTLLQRRDLAAGLLPQRPGPAHAPARLRSAFALAWRLQRGLLAWPSGGPCSAVPQGAWRTRS